MADQETKWIGWSGRVKRFEAKDGKPARTFINVSFKKEDLDKLYVSSRGYVFIQLMKKPQPDQYKNEFSIMEDSWAVNNDKEKNGGWSDPFDDWVSTEEDEARS